MCGADTIITTVSTLPPFYCAEGGQLSVLNFEKVGLEKRVPGGTENVPVTYLCLGRLSFLCTLPKKALLGSHKTPVVVLFKSRC